MNVFIEQSGFTLVAIVGPALVKRDQGGGGSFSLFDKGITYLDMYVAPIVGVARF